MYVVPTPIPDWPPWQHRSMIFVEAAAPLPSPDAARLWMFAWHPPMQQEPEEMMQRRRLLTEKHVIIEVNSKIFECKLSSIAFWSGRPMGGDTQLSREPCNTQRTWQLVGPSSGLEDLSAEVVSMGEHE